MKTKDVVLISIVLIVLYALNLIIPLLIILGIVLFIKHKNKPKIEQKPHRRPIEIEDTSHLEEYRATLAECEELIANDRQLRSEADLRQFQGRTDVTRKELATYMFEQRWWDGIYERRLQMEEIIKVCNLTEKDIEWVEQELEHYHSDSGQVLDNKILLTRNEEERIVYEYQKEQEAIRIKKEIAKEMALYKQQMEVNKFNNVPDSFMQFSTDNHNRLLRTYANCLRRYDYDFWLKMKGYIK